MRLLLPSFALALPLVIPTVAEASPFAIRLSTTDLIDLTVDDQDQEPAATSAPAMGEGEAASSDATAEPADPTAPVEEGTEPAADEAIGDPTAEGLEDELLEDELEGPQKKGDFNRHAIGFNGGMQIIPSYFVSKALATYANSVCRKEVGNWGEQNGLSRVDGCNFYVNGGYLVRIHRGFDIQANVGYLHIKLPDSYWLDNNEWDRDSCEANGDNDGACNLGAADYTQVDLRMVTLEVNFIGRGTLYRNQDVEVQLGGGGGIGAGILVGKGIFQTPLGAFPGSPDDPTSCQTLADLSDFRKCTPRYDEFSYNDIEQFDDTDVTRDQVDMGADLPTGKATSRGDSWVTCQRDQCDGSDLDAIGRAAPKGQPWAAYPVVNLFLSFRMIVKDTFGITIDGGIKNGFFFGGGMQYYFGGGGKDRDKDKAKTKNTAAPVESETESGTE